MIPELQRRGLFRTEYESISFRGDLWARFPRRAAPCKTPVRISPAYERTRQMRLGLSVANFGYYYWPHGVWAELAVDADHDIGHHLRSAEIAERGL